MTHKGALQGAPFFFLLVDSWAGNLNRTMPLCVT